MNTDELKPAELRVCRVCGETACGGACEADEMRAAADPEPEWWHDY